MMNRTERMNTLVNAGIDTSKYFNLAIDKDLPKGTTLTITIGDDGLPTIDKVELMKMMDDIAEQGYVKNSNLFRRWVMAQMFRMMKHKDGFTGALKEKPYHYQWKVLENELHAMSKIEKEDPKQFEIRKVFYTKEVILAMLEDYKKKASKEYNNAWNQLRLKEAEGIANITITAIKNATTYDRYYKVMKEFRKEIYKTYSYIGLNSRTELCKEFVSAYKGTGAYYTLDNLFKYHLKKNIRIPEFDYPVVLSCALAVLEMKRTEYALTGEWYKLFGWMKEIIRLNHFNFDYAMYKEYHQ